jgi:hypothetical protein
MDSSIAPSTRPLYRGTQIVWYILGVLEVILALRFILKLLDANSAAAFTRFIYDLSGVFTAPFESVFRISYVSGAVFEWTTLLAMIIYWLIAYAIIKLFVMSRSVSTPEAAVRLRDQEGS